MFALHEVPLSVELFRIVCYKCSMSVEYSEVVEGLSIGREWFMLFDRFYNVIPDLCICMMIGLLCSIALIFFLIISYWSL